MINGVAVFSYNLARGLAARGHEVAVICPSQTGKSYSRTIDGVKTYYLKSVQAKVYPDQIHDVPKRKKWLGVELPNLLYKHGFRVSVFPQREIKRILTSFQPDVVHVQVSDPIGLSVVSYARKHGIPVVTTEHNQPEVITEPLGVPKFIKKPMDALLSAYFANRQSKSDFVTMPTKKAITKLLSERNFTVPIAAVSNGVDLSHFKPGKATKEFYKKFGLDSDTLTVLYVGRVDPEKNVGAVIEAFLEADVDNAKLVIVGDGVDVARLKKKYGEHKSVHFLGKIVPPELYDVYRMGDLFVTASEIETQGIVLIEAAATGLPLIAVDAGAVSEVCVSGENGVLCRPGDVNEMAMAMKEIINDDSKRNKFAKKSIEIAMEHDFEKTLDKFTNIYKKVMAETNRQSR
jgi:glycosyltransferase involved in cell wall biosynthesis